MIGSNAQQAYREAALSLDELSALECALIGATATTKAIVASKRNNLRALPDEDLAAAVETLRAAVPGVEPVTWVDDIDREP